MSGYQASKHLTRRQALRLLGMGAGMTLLAACGQSAQPAPTAAPAKPAEAAKPADAAKPAESKPAAPAAAPAATTAPAPAATAAPAAAAQQAPAKTGGTVPLRFFFWNGSEEESKFWQDLAADASKTVGNVEVKFETDSFANFWTKLPADAASGTVADILGLQSLRTAGFTSRNLYLPLDDLIKDDKSFDLSDFDKTIVDGLSYKGKLYALSYDFGPNIVYVNKTLFQKAGVDLPKPGLDLERLPGDLQRTVQEDRRRRRLRHRRLEPVRSNGALDHVERRRLRQRRLHQIDPERPRDRRGDPVLRRHDLQE